MPQPVPIFVDDTGRRRRLVRRFAMVATSMALAYVVVLVATLVGLPGLGRFPLPGVADLRGSADPAQTSVGDRTVEERLPDLAPPPSGVPVASTTTAATTTGGSRMTTSSGVPRPASPSTSSATPSIPATTVTSTSTPPGRGSTTTTVVPPGRGSTTTTAPASSSTTSPGRGTSPPSTDGPR